MRLRYDVATQLMDFLHKPAPPGHVFKIDFSHGYSAYGLKLQDNGLAVYDVLTQDAIVIDEIIRRPVIFVIPGVFEKAFRRWVDIGSARLRADQLHRPETFVQDILDPRNIRILNERDGEFYERPATFDEIQDLERAAAWDYDHVENRILDHFAETTNWLVETHRPKPPDAPHYSPAAPYIPQPGAIKRIDLRDGTFVYARELTNTFFAVYDLRTTEAVPPPTLTEHHVLFVVSVSLSARLGWPKVGFVPLGPDEHPLPNRYAIYGWTLRDLKIFLPDDDFLADGFVPRSATLEEVERLEPAVMWDNYQVENRVRAHYAGTPWHWRGLLEVPHIKDYSGIGSNRP